MTVRPLPSHEEVRLRRAIVAAVRRLDELGLNVNSSGNVSARLGDRFVVTPSGIAATELTEDLLVVLDADGTPAGPGQPVPTSEWQLHAALLAARSDVAAIVHTHSPEATAAATHRRPVPAIHYVVARFGSADLPCAPYATYGTAELAAAVVTTLGATGRACLMANHGALTAGADLAAAVGLALDVEWLCAVFRRAVALGDPVVLDDAEVARVAARSAGYGQPSTPS